MHGVMEYFHFYPQGWHCSESLIWFWDLSFLLDLFSLIMHFLLQVLQNQVQFLQSIKTDESKEMDLTKSLDNKEKSVASSSTCVSDCGRHGNVEEMGS